MEFLKKHKIALLLVLFLSIGIACPFLFMIYEQYKPYYDGEYFGIETIYSDVDANNNGVDDYTDILLGARADAINHPKYDGKYWDTGYPPDNIGVCTDVVWRAFKKAGYNLRMMVDQDIKKYNDKDYHLKYPDSNIDFRRVGNLYIFFNKYAEVLTLDTKKIDEWQPGDIVTFGKYNHIGIISDKRNRKGIPYVIHNSGQKNREEDVLEIRDAFDGITGHFRWNAKDLQDIIVYWED